MKKTMWIIAALLSGLFIVEAEAAPVFQAAGTAVTGTGAVTPAWPVHAINDVALLFVESTGGQPATLSTPAGFAAVLNSPQATGLTTAGTRITVFWARATSAAMTAPTVADPGDHVYAQIITYRGVMNTGNPWDITGGGVKTPASTTVTVTGVTTTVPNTLIVQAVARDNDLAAAAFSAETNASLTGILERSDAGTASGNGGGFAVWDGVKATAGATGNTTATVTSSINAFLTIALKPTTVASINRADPNPTVAASVSWTVTFYTSVSGVSSSNFALVNSGLGGTPAITSVTGSGTTWTVTASTGTGNGTLGLDMVNTTGVSPAVAGLPFTGQVYSVRQITATYYHDTTNGVNIGFDGTTNVTSGTNQIIPPIITASLITASTCAGSARSASHPTGLYTHSRWYLTTNYAVATNIAANPGGSAFLRGQAATDTVIVRLYDYNPVSGAKVLIGSSPVITLTGAGTTTAYPYTISSTLYTVPAGNRLMLQYDFNQPVATNVARVYCSATLAYITVTESTATVAPHHIQIDHDGVGQTCRAETLTVTACANAACTAPHFTAATVTGNVTWTGSPGGSLPFTITSGGTGQTTVLLPVTTAQTVTLGTSSVSPVETNPPSTCVNASGGAACSIVFSAASACFDAVEVGAVSTPLFTKLSGTAFSLDVTAATAYSGTLQVELVNSSTGTCATYASLNPANSQSTTFTSQTRKTLSFTYANAAKDVKVRITGLAASSCSSGRFAIRPQSLTVTSSANADATGTNVSATPAVKAGAAFTLNAAVSETGYDGTPAVNNAKILAHAAAVATGSISGAFTAANPATGVATGSNFTYSEAGYFKADVDGVYDDTFTAVDSAAGDCTNDFSNILVGGKYGCKFGNTAVSNYFGRFIPDHFAITTDTVSPIVTQADFLPQTKTTVSAPALAGNSTISVAATTGFNVGSQVRIPGAGAGGNAFTATVTAIGASTLTLNTGIGSGLAGDGTEDVIAEWGSYMGERMNAQFTLNAVTLSGATTQNYQGAYAKLNPAVAGNPLGLGAVDMAGPTYNLALDTSSVATGSFSSGSATIIAPLAVVRGASAVGPYNSVKIGIAPTTAEADGVRMGAYNLGVTSAVNDHTSIMDPLVQDVTAVRYGRMKISNAHGSELLSLPVALTAQYWNGTAYVTNADDNDTVLAITDIVLGTYQRKTGDTWITSPALVNGTAAQGGWTVNLSKPTATFTGKGSVDLTTNAPTYLPSNTGLATFGVYKGNNDFIYLRENY